MDLDKHIGKIAALISANDSEHRFGLEGELCSDHHGRYGTNLGNGNYFYFMAHNVKALVEIGDKIIVYL